MYQEMRETLSYRENRAEYERLEKEQQRSVERGEQDELLQPLLLPGAQGGRGGPRLCQGEGRAQPQGQRGDGQAAEAPGGTVQVHGQGWGPTRVLFTGTS